MAEPLLAHYRQVLARRLAEHSPSVQQRLRERMDAVPASVEVAQPVAPAPRASALAKLNAELAQRAQGATGSIVTDSQTTLPELSSVRRFGKTWAKVATEQQMIEALAKAPKNAGPLNSHRLMLRALTQMRRLSPDYLRLFLAQMEALLWVEEAVVRLPKVAAKAKGSAGRGVKRKG